MKIAIIGECMLELSNSAAGQISRGMACSFNFGGDTLNTAIYMARAGVDVSYFSALGDDVYSQWLLNEWRSEGIDVAQVECVPGAMPGLYMIQTDNAGERSFSYWRDSSAARRWLQDSAQVPNLTMTLDAFDCLYLSGISLSLMSDEFFEGLLAALPRLRADGLKIAFDVNYRPRGWASPAMAMARVSRILSFTDIALPTFDDEALLFGDCHAEQTQARYMEYGVEECIVKLGAEGALCRQDTTQQWVPTEPCESVIDSTGAGDSFNAGYLSARLRGADMHAACRAGHKLAGEVIKHRGAIIPLSATEAVL